jgi:hypothetical protein
MGAVAGGVVAGAATKGTGMDTVARGVVAGAVVEGAVMGAVVEGVVEGAVVGGWETAALLSELVVAQVISPVHTAKRATRTAAPTSKGVLSPEPNLDLPEANRSPNNPDMMRRG